VLIKLGRGIIDYILEMGMGGFIMEKKGLIGRGFEINERFVRF